MKSEKPSFVVALYQRVGDWLGVSGALESGTDSQAYVGQPMVERSEEDVRAGLAAIGELAKFQLRLRKAGVTPDEVENWINEDRRV